MNHPSIVFQVQRTGLIFKKDVERRKEIFLKRSTAWNWGWNNYTWRHFRASKKNIWISNFKKFEGCSFIRKTHYLFFCPYLSATSQHACSCSSNSPAPAKASLNFMIPVSVIMQSYDFSSKIFDWKIPLRLTADKTDGAIIRYATASVMILLNPFKI